VAAVRARNREGGVLRRADRRRSLGDERWLREFRPPEADLPERLVIDWRLPGPDDPDTD
jgi:hypothetical protein